ncbi:hypothetical protein Nepgr_026889 [Nepenthes gracilis]|uniref:WEB family protein n=1 Tax=Nepenthes gracilis TaxID=150966 RepID=A0AAD3T9E1_NEPGR|nr:hypothetical protein Nepgr_026889 [Nepenthes gracilis]
MAGNLHVKLRKSKSELDACLAEEDKARGVSNEMISTLNQASSEAENARLEAEDMKIKAEQLYMEAETTKLSLEAAEKQLKLALEEAVEAKAAEARALDQIKTLTERTDAARSSTNAVITISREEFESLSHKAQVSDKLAEMKVAAAMAQVEAIKVSENEALQRLEAAQKEMSDIKAATEEALRRAEMAEAAKKAVDCELGRWHEREQKKAAEAAAQILGETRSLPQSPVHYKVQKPNPSQKVEKMEKQRTSTFPKKVLLRNLSGIFQMKKSSMEVGSPSFIPGEDGI